MSIFNWISRWSKSPVSPVADYDISPARTNVASTIAQHNIFAAIHNGVLRLKKFYADKRPQKSTIKFS